MNVHNVWLSFAKDTFSMDEWPEAYLVFTVKDQGYGSLAVDSSISVLLDVVTEVLGRGPNRNMVALAGNAKR